MAYYKPGDVVWAKMRGHPPWPASILQTSTQLTGVPSGRYSVQFYGTYETAIMKSGDLFDYLKHRQQFEVRRENKGFASAVREAQEAVGLLGNSKREESLLELHSATTPSTSRIADAAAHAHSRPRRPSSRFTSDEYVLQPLRGRINSQSQHTLDSPQKLKSKGIRTEKKNDPSLERRRRESGSSVGSNRKRTISTFFDLDAFDNDPMMSSMLSDGFGNSLLDEFHGDLNGEVPKTGGTKHKRTPKPKLFEDFIAPGRSRTPSRERNNSTDSSGRTRLISGVSDILEELGDQHFNAADFMSVLNDFDDERPVSPEEPLPMPAPIKYCSDCACLCQLYGLKWRCTNKSCLKWNGTHDPYGKGGELSKLSQLKTEENFSAVQPAIGVPETSTASVLPDSTSVLSGTNDVKMEPGKFEPILPENSLVEQMSEVQAATLAITTSEPLSFPVHAQANGVNAASTDPSSLFSAKKYLLSSSRSSAASPSASANTTLPRRQLGAGRPKSYKVEKTPPVTENGQRLCAFCGGQVRPQMCGGNKHRWRCVDKKCRKWYGWVRSNEEIPKDLGKKGRWKDLALKIRRKGVSDEDAETGNNADVTANKKLNSYISTAVPLCERQPKKLGRPPKPRVGKVKLKLKKKMNGITSESEPSGMIEGERPKRKYTRRGKPAEEDRSLRFSPLLPEAMSFRPSAMERRGRWWTNEKRRHDTSPEREWNARSPLDTAAAMHVLAHSMRVAANTLADEQGTVSGSLDLLMDALMSSLAPLLSLTAQLPPLSLSNEVLQQLWDSSSVHTPIFS